MRRTLLGIDPYFLDLLRERLITYPTFRRSLPTTEQVKFWEPALVQYSYHPERCLSANEVNHVAGVLVFDEARPQIIALTF